MWIDVVITDCRKLQSMLKNTLEIEEVCGKTFSRKSRSDKGEK
jgi:hypothetical protein